MRQPADIIITNAKVFTGDQANPYAEAVVLKGNRIIYVGDNSGAEEYRSEQTRIIDGQRRTLTAGFIDTHVHLLSGAIWMGHAELREIRTKEQLKKELLDFAEENKTTDWIAGRGIPD